jgi:hypothetical protein
MKRRTAAIAVFAAASLGALALFAAFSLGAARNDVAAGSRAEKHSLLFTQSAMGGALKPAGGNRMTLTLRGIPSQVVWFQDRPDRHAGDISAAAFESHWRAFGFQSDAPNAALTLLDAPDKADTVVVELLRRPRYKPAQATMTYEVRPLSGTPDGLDDFGDDVDDAVPASFGAAALFIDAARVDGGDIQNVARREAFLAAAGAGEVRMRHLRDAENQRPREEGEEDADDPLDDDGG